ncbi:transaldolase [Aerococcus agrisoli]|uniref:Transaldolase n=1 Tax=Aerococcus agrisoli TaxID=2487350 RepID=A0A3N4GD57_9LACT|nr:transaldolase family protein [Aerococcus agrisoli]RPA60763.1 transaldolase [Aerococcus agrisoli]
MYLDTADITLIEHFDQLGILKGVTTNPSILRKIERNRWTQLQAIQATTEGHVFCQVVGNGFDDLLADFEQIKKIEEQALFAIKVPVNFEGLKFIKYLKETEPERKVLGTAIYSADQGILAALAGCDFIAPYVNRMLNNNIDPFAEITSMRLFIDERDLATEIMGASFKNTSQVVSALNAGAHTATVAPDILEAMMEKQLATNAIAVFNEDGQVTFEA